MQCMFSEKKKNLLHGVQLLPLQPQRLQQVVLCTWLSHHLFNKHPNLQVEGGKVKEFASAQDEDIDYP